MYSCPALVTRLQRCGHRSFDFSIVFSVQKRYMLLELKSIVFIVKKSWNISMFLRWFSFDPDLFRFCFRTEFSMKINI